MAILDIDECINGCDVNAVCTNTHGSYTCTCQSGYSGDGVICEGVLKHDIVYNTIVFWPRQEPTAFMQYRSKCYIRGSIPIQAKITSYV